MKRKCCEKCLGSKFALKGKDKEFFGGICGLACECHLSKRYDYLGFEEKTAKLFKEKKPQGKTNTQFLEELLKVL